ncbi:uncharacterized protein PV06_10982 [Exophiala oligosperma]|uniref:Uncharacterized protein n=2 Tax=Exophiala oligosperma TaxID=215243 RepID=A0A0D2BHC4_9EURO|nr:uncharacterized protein PV06_10982 [Exophiala oligosperma]KIW36867.1 hypothetical protein PV06_10982 [Exophiala oligosperma]
MARTLPWTTDHAPPPKKQRTIGSVRSHTEPSSPPALGRLSEAVETPAQENLSDRTPAKRDRGATPTSSPVKAPPSSELMHDGYDGDDIYIMVEDEFNTVAQSYTAHLHLAEYKRLVKQAREAPPKALPEPTSPMSKQAKQRLKADALQHRQKDVLQRVLGRSAVDEEEDAGDDLWSGTSLAPLMTGSNPGKTSLLGLEKISSNTKAGMGFVRPNSSGSSGKDSESDDLSWDRKHVGKAPMIRDDDLSTRATSSTSRTTLGKASRIRVATTTRQRHNQDRPQPISPELRSVDKESNEQGIGQSFLRRSQTTSRQHKDRLRTRQLKEQEEKSRLEEVPMFII